MTPSKQPAKIPRPSIWANRIGPSGRNTRPVSVLVSVFDPVRVVPPAQTTGLGMGATTGFQS